MIAARGVGVRRAGRDLLDGIDLDVIAGEVLAIVGPNGAGKTTLLRVLSGEIAADRGSVRIDGRDMGDWPADALARRRAVMSQQHALAFDLDAAEVIELGRLPWRERATRAEDESACRWAAQAAGAEPLLGRAYASLSGGEQARVQFARALAQVFDAERARRALFLDEPTASLDPGFRVQLLQSARVLAGDGLAVVVIVHDLNEALAVADRCLLLDRGRAAAFGPPLSVLVPPRLERLYGTPFRRVDGWLAPVYGITRRSDDVTCPSSP